MALPYNYQPMYPGGYDEYRAEWMRTWGNYRAGTPMELLTPEQRQAFQMNNQFIVDALPEGFSLDQLPAGISSIPGYEPIAGENTGAGPNRPPMFTRTQYQAMEQARRTAFDSGLPMPESIFGAGGPLGIFLHVIQPMAFGAMLTSLAGSFPTLAPILTSLRDNPLTRSWMDNLTAGDTNFENIWNSYKAVTGLYEDVTGNINTSDGSDRNFGGDTTITTDTDTTTTTTTNSSFDSWRDRVGTNNVTMARNYIQGAFGDITDPGELISKMREDPYLGELLGQDALADPDITRGLLSEGTGMSSDVVDGVVNEVTNTGANSNATGNDKILRDAGYTDSQITGILAGLANGDYTLDADGTLRDSGGGEIDPVDIGQDGNINLDTTFGTNTTTTTDGTTTDGTTTDDTTTTDNTTTNDTTTNDTTTNDTTNADPEDEFFNRMYREYGIILQGAENPDGTRKIGSEVPADEYNQRKTDGTLLNTNTSGTNTDGTNTDGTNTDGTNTDGNNTSNDNLLNDLLPGIVTILGGIFGADGLGGVLGDMLGTLGTILSGGNTNTATGGDATGGDATAEGGDATAEGGDATAEGGNVSGSGNSTIGDILNGANMGNVSLEDLLTMTMEDLVTMGDVQGGSVSGSGNSENTINTGDTTLTGGDNTLTGGDNTINQGDTTVDVGGQNTDVTINNPETMRSNEDILELLRSPEIANLFNAFQREGTYDDLMEVWRPAAAKYDKMFESLNDPTKNPFVERALAFWDNNMMGNELPGGYQNILDNTTKAIQRKGAAGGGGTAADAGATAYQLGQGVTTTFRQMANQDLSTIMSGIGPTMGAQAQVAQRYPELLSAMADVIAGGGESEETLARSAIGLLGEIL